MDARKRWRRAIILSIAVNILLLCGVGILTTGFLSTDQVEQLVEVDLVSDYSSQQSVDTGQGQVSTNTTATQMVVPRNMTSSTPVAVQTETSLSVDEVSSDVTTENAIVEAKVGGSSINGSTSGSNTVSGGPSGNGTGNGGQGSGNPSGGILRPQILSKVQPTYPEAARQAGTTGTVLLKVQILENGRVGDVSVQQSSGNDLLDDSAVTTVYQWRFTPAQEKNTGRAVVCYTTVPVVFRLN